jgi:hypothetical protein
VEYILLLAVVVSLILTFYNSEAYRRLFGSKGKFAKMIKEESEFSYRQAYSRTSSPDITVPNAGEREITQYPSYKAPSGDTRFFGPRNPYP